MIQTKAVDHPYKYLPRKQQKTIGGKWEENRNQLTEQHGVTQRKCTQDICGELREQKIRQETKGERRKMRACTAAIAAIV